MREPAKSCGDCGKVLLPAEILYTPDAELVCEACLGATSFARAGAPMRVRTRADRRRALYRWSFVFVGLTFSAAYVGQVARAQLRAARPMAAIDSPRAHAEISGRVVAVGHVVPETIVRPLWLVATSGAAAGVGCAPLVRAPLVADKAGAFAVTLDLAGVDAGGVRLAVVSTDEGASEAFDAPPAVVPHGFQAELGGPSVVCRPADTGGPWTFPRGALVLASVDVTLSDPNR